MTISTLAVGLSQAEAHLRRPRNGDGNDSPDISFADRVRNLRNRLGLSQPAFADRYGLPLGTIRSWEQGRRTPPDATGALLIRLIERDPNGLARLVEHI